MAKKPGKNADTSNLLNRGGIWYLRYMVGGKAIFKSTHKTKLSDAQEIRDRELQVLDLTDERERMTVIKTRIDTIDDRINDINDQHPAMTVLQVWEAFKVKPKGKTARGRVIKPGERTLGDYEGRWNAFCKWMDDNYPKKDDDGEKIPWELRQITRLHAEKYLAEVDASRSGNTFNKTMTFLRLVFKVLSEDAKIKANPFDGIDAAQHAIMKKRPVTREEIAKIAEILKGKGEMELLFALGYHTGARRGDCVLMKWGNNIDMGAHKIRYTPHKTAKGNQEITLTIAPELYWLLEATPPGRRRGYVLPELAESYKRDPAALTRRIQQVFKDADIETTEEVKGYGNRVARVGFHSLRHANITAMIEAGVPLDVVQRQAGHSTIGMTAHYHTISAEALKAASEAIPSMTPPKALPAPVSVTSAILAQIDTLSCSDLEEVATKVKEAIDRQKKQQSADFAKRPGGKKGQKLLRGQTS